MSYLAIVLFLGLFGILCWIAFYFYFRSNPEKYGRLSAVAAILLLGPLLPLVHSSLAKRNYAISNREIWGLVVVGALLVAAVTISLVFGVGIRGR